MGLPRAEMRRVAVILVVGLLVSMLVLTLLADSTAALSGELATLRA